jgi:hypothetical protein
MQKEYDPETVEELIEMLQKCNPKAKVTLYYNTPIHRVMEIGGDSYKTNEVKIMTLEDNRF